MALKDLKVKIDLDTSAFQKGVKEAENGANGLNKKFSAAMGGITKAIAGVTTALAGIGTLAVKEFADTEGALAKVNTLLGLSGKDAEAYFNQIKQGANESGMAYDDYAEAVYQAISAGVDYKDATGFVNEANKLAKGGFTDLTTATDTLTTVLNAYGLEADQQTAVMDMLIMTQNKGKTTVDELGASIGKVIPTAAAANVGFGDVSAAMAIMTANGISTAESSTYLNSMINEMSKSGTGVAKVIKEQTGKSFQDLMADGWSLGDVLGVLKETTDKQGIGFGDLFSSSEAAKAGLAMLNGGTEEYNETLKTITSTTGATDEAFNIMDDTIKSKVSKAVNEVKNNFSDFGGELMERFAPIIEAAIDAFVDLTDKLVALPAWIEENKTMLTLLGIVIGTITAAIAAYTIVQNIATIATTIATVAGTAFGAVMAFITSPITLVVLAIGALIAIVYLLATNWDWISAKTAEIWNNIKTWISTKVEEIKNNISNWINNVKSSFSNGFESAKSTVVGIFNSIKDSITNTINGARDVVKKAIDKIKSFFKFEWSLPKIKMPHISIKGEFSLMPPSVPSFGIDWRSRGGIFTKRSILPGGVGVGDTINGSGNSPEAVLPIDRLPQLLGLDKRQESGTGVANIFIELDGRTIARSVGQELTDIVRVKTGLSL